MQDHADQSIKQRKATRIASFLEGEAVARHDQDMLGVEQVYGDLDTLADFFVRRKMHRSLGRSFWVGHELTEEETKSKPLTKLLMNALSFNTDAFLTVRCITHIAPFALTLMDMIFVLGGEGDLKAMHRKFAARYFKSFEEFKAMHQEATRDFVALCFDRRNDRVFSYRAKLQNN